MSALVYASCSVLADTDIVVEAGRYPFAAVRVGVIGNDLRITGQAADLARLADALHEAAASLEEPA